MRNFINNLTFLFKKDIKKELAWMREFNRTKIEVLDHSVEILSHKIVEVQLKESKQ